MSPLTPLKNPLTQEDRLFKKLSLD
ncbi:hypothetical protein BGL59_01690 [Helicobacter pylori]|nr:hypothetical protein BGL56_00250 [Helicobacter pylori]OPG29398.1 hypothetical protein BGL59_01690 [Helicobacter pylori]